MREARASLRGYKQVNKTWFRVPGSRGSGPGESGVLGYVGTARGKAGCSSLSEEGPKDMQAGHGKVGR